MQLFGRLNRYLAYLIAIVILASVLRLWSLAKYPVGFTPDEASFGYDAYSLLTTGKDQWGESWPISFRSFGDFKLPIYTYLTIPSVYVFGLNEFAVRFPSALVGILAVISTYLMAFAVFKDKRIALFSSLMLAISPWHVPLSRGAFEANLTVAFMSLGVWSFYRSLEARSKLWIVFASVFFGINLFTYHSARLVTPILVLILIYLNRDKLRKSAVNFVSVLIFGIFLSIAVFNVFAGGGARAGDVTIFNPTDKGMGVFETRYKSVVLGLPNVLGVFFHNNIFDVALKFCASYLSYFSPQFLFTGGPGEWTYGMVPGWGVMYLPEMFFVLASVWILMKHGFKKESGLGFLACWILVSVIPAALTKGPGYAANRAAVMMPAIQIFSAYGFLILYQNLKVRIGKNLIVILMSLVIFTASVFYFEAYFFVAPSSGADGMLYGRKEAMNYVFENHFGYKEIIISRTISEPQIYAAFYGKINPELYQSESHDWLRYEKEGHSFVDQLGEYRLGKLVFKNISYTEDSLHPDVLLIGKPDEFPTQTVPVKIINFPNFKPALSVVDPAKNN